jgi:D-alanyl-D-alanine carboxypeptidase
MNQTTYRNASGLPDGQQITTARDQAILGRAIQDRFPNYYHYFATRTFEYRGHAMRNHNHLLGVVDGVDGIKTGYIRDSGFNIVTSVRRANHHLVAVVFGGRSAPARDARVRSLIDNNINIAAVKRTAPPVVEGWETALARKEQIDKEKKDNDRDDDRTGSSPVRVASVTRAPSDTPLPGSTDPIKPNTVKTVAVHPGSMRTAALTPLPSESRQLMPTPAEATPASITTVTVKNEQSPAVAPPVPAAPAPEPPVAKSDPSPPASPAKIASAVAIAPMPAPEPNAKPRSGWIIQIGALPDEKDAWQRLELAQTRAKNLLGKADPFTERIEKGEKVLFRARFAGLEKNQAEAACKHLKRSDIPCMLVKY